MTPWWSKRSERERLLISAGGAVIAVLGAAQFAVAPLVAWRRGTEARAAAAEERYQLVARSAALATPVQATSAEPVRNVLNATAAALGVELTFVNALADGSVDIQAGPVAPDRLFELLSRLEREHGVKVTSADVSRASEDADLVRVQASLGR
ncbi:MAG: type II secretion system protein M [Parvularculaceae bacterium]|nr:type II secretion system protein M [Parvularculaceae bacterium]